MLFNSLEYVIFLPAVILLYYLTPWKLRWILLLFASYYFYACWRVEYLGLIAFSTLIDYYAARKMGKIDEKKRRKPWLVLSLFTNIGLLFFFKYYNFASESYVVLIQNFNIFQQSSVLDVLLPVGISFYTFQTLSYSIEVYRGKQKPEKHLGIFAVYVSFFPQLVAGPIERFNRLGPQLMKKINFSYNNFVNGMRLILFGLFIKMVVADNLAVYVDLIYSNALSYSSLDILTGLFFYSFQIYADFAGYSLIAIGSALTLGVFLMDNFKTPYLSKSIAEFWQRWHISLSTWFRDYLYFPLGGNRVKWFRAGLNILVVFAISGLWHGAGWTFLVWGLIFAFFYLAEKSANKIFKLKSKNSQLISALLIIKTFAVVSIAWIFFRSSDIYEAERVFTGLFQNSITSSYLRVEPVVWLFLALFILSEFVLYNKRFDFWCAKLPVLARWTVYSVLIFAIIVFSGVQEFPFIYFQF
ncbi:MAG: MBOAT family protein [Bacteroidales bacterium]|nr:MBOAT family protein [Bacteroidales bacterium]